MKLTLLMLILLSSNSFANEIDETLNKARAIKLNNGESEGFVLKEVSSGSMFENLGLKSNDKITQINGKKVTGLSEVMDGMANVKSITVVRDGKEKKLNYSIND